jgi:hypothetical protein
MAPSPKTRTPARPVAALGEDLLYPVFLAHVPLPEKLDFDSVGRGKLFGVFSQLVPEGVRKTRIVENPHLVGIQVRRHPFGVADLRQRSEDQHTVPATQHSVNLLRVPFGD